MKKILAFSGSNSSKSINHELVAYVGSLIKDHSIKVIKLTDFDIPMYSEDMERGGFPSGVKELHSEITGQDGLVISVPEHNGNLTAFLKNILDWLSRFDRPFLSGIKIFVISTSPGGRGGRSSLEAAKTILPYFKGEIVSSFSLSFFSKNFSNGIIDQDKDEELKTSLQNFLEHL